MLTKQLINTHRPVLTWSEIKRSSIETIIAYYFWTWSIRRRAGFVLQRTLVPAEAECNVRTSVKHFITHCSLSCTRKHFQQNYTQKQKKWQQHSSVYSVLSTATPQYSIELQGNPAIYSKYPKFKIPDVQLHGWSRTTSAAGRRAFWTSDIVGHRCTRRVWSLSVHTCACSGHNVRLNTM